MKLVSQIKQTQITAPTDNDIVIITGMSAFNGDLLICADWNNRCVKSLRISKGAMQVLFIEVEPDWRVSTACLTTDTNGEVLIALEWSFTTHETRVCISRKQIDGNFRSVDCHTRDDSFLSRMNSQIIEKSA